MSELTIIINHEGHEELKEYLLSLNGIMYVEIKNEEKLKIYLKYDSNVITLKIIKMELLLFLSIIKVPSILAFDKHSKTTNCHYQIKRDDVCCEYCLMGAIEDLFEIDGIEKVESNFNGKCEKIIIDIKYNPNLVSLKKIEQIELNI